MVGIRWFAIKKFFLVNCKLFLADCHVQFLICLFLFFHVLQLLAVNDKNVSRIAFAYLLGVCAFLFLDAGWR